MLVDDNYSSHRQIPSLMYRGCRRTLPADCSVTRHETAGRSSRSVTVPSHTNTQPMSSCPGRPPPDPPPPTAYKYLPPPRIDDGVTAECLQCTDQLVSSNADARTTCSELAGSDVNRKTPTHWNRRRSLSLPACKYHLLVRERCF